MQQDFKKKKTSFDPALNPSTDGDDIVVPKRFDGPLGSSKGGGGGRFDVTHAETVTHNA